MWIEIFAFSQSEPCPESLPLRECGLKFLSSNNLRLRRKSLPLRECGLKLENRTMKNPAIFVTPLAGVWIEIVSGGNSGSMYILSLPLRECGLKYFCVFCWDLFSTSLPLRECGLKLKETGMGYEECFVTPLAGVWIEIIGTVEECRAAVGHSPCGSVD